MPDPLDQGGFLDSDANTGEPILCVLRGPIRGWLCTRGGDGQWVARQRMSEYELRMADAIENFGADDLHMVKLFVIAGGSR